jgi:hypothetical protein
MTRLRLLTLLLGAAIALGSATVVPAAPSLAWPDSPAGRAARAYFAMLADGSESAIRTFESTYRAAEALAKVPLEERVRRTEDLRFRLGDLTPTEIIHADANRLQIVAVGSKSGEVEVEFVMAAPDPTRLASIALTLEGPGTRVASRSLTPEYRAKLVEGVARAVAETYVDPALGRTMADKVRQLKASGAYAEIADERAIAHQLTEDLRSVSHDLHLAVRLSPAEPGGAPMHPMQPADEARDNYGFRSVELLEGNIGLVRLDAFVSTPEALQTADAAMAFLKHADAIIFDLRRNTGGDPEMIRRLTSYFFSGRTHLNSMVDRTGATVEDFWTGDVPGTRFRDKLPVFVLTSSFTFSCAEEFTYDLKNLKRATIVGETTGGGAHPVQPVRVDDRFVVAVPFLRALNPVTKTNWEGVGVEPDVKTGSEQALNKALELARAATRRSPAPAS